MAAFLKSLFGAAPPALPPPVAFTEVLPALVAASFAGSALGFVRPVWFISVGECVLWGEGVGGQERAGEEERAREKNKRRRPHMLTSAKQSAPGEKSNPTLPFLPHTHTNQPGYGLACILQVVVASRALAARGVTPLARCALGAFAAHGVWMAGFLLARDLLLATYR